MRRRSSVIDFKRPERPSWGWQGPDLAWANPRTPSVPASLNLTLEEYYAAAAVMGVLASQVREPDLDWLVPYAHDIGARMAREANQRRKRRKR